MKLSTYILPIRRRVFSEAEAVELREYLSILGDAFCEAIVVDGSSPEIFAKHHDVWSSVCRHESFDLRFKYLNDKVNGIHTGVALATTEKIILADDDIRYTTNDIEKICALLDDFEVVRPQNYLAANLVTLRPHLNPLPQGEEDAQRQVRVKLPPWARMEAARMLINRATLRTADYPGTCAFRKKTMLGAGEYDGDVLFDNEEIVRHFARHSARILYANNFFIRKRPSRFRKWIEQRPRQAYEDFGLRFKTILFASLFSLAIAVAFIDLRWMSVFLFSILLAAAGLLRGGARKHFPFTICLFAPLWVFERSLSTYWAFYWFVRRGGYPFGDRLLSKGIGRDWIEGGKIAARQ